MVSVFCSIDDNLFREAATARWSSQPLGRAVILRRSRRICGCFSGVHAVQGSPVIGRLAVVPVTAEVGPSRIDRFDKCDLLRASPAFEFFLACDRSLHILVTLEPNKTIEVVARSEPAMLLPFMLENAFQEIARHSDVERVAAAGYYVCEIGAAGHGCDGSAGRGAWL